MNVLFLALDVDLQVPRGDAIHTRELARLLAARGHRVDLVVAHPSERGIGDGVHVHVRPKGTWSTVRFCARLADEARSEAIYERRLSPKVSFAVSRLAGIPFVVEINGTEDEARMQGRAMPSLWRPPRAFVRRRMYRYARFVVAVTTRLGEEVRSRNGLAPQRVVVVPNGVDPDSFVPKDSLEARSSLGWPNGRWIVFVGNLVPWQGLKPLLHAMPAVFADHPDARLAIVGDGIERGALEALSSRLEISNRLLFAGAVGYEEVPLCIGAAEVCVAPFGRARNEQIGLSPLKVYEYMSCGRAVVATDVPGVADLINGSGGGLLVPPDDFRALGAALSRLLSDPRTAAEMGQRGRAYVREGYSWGRTAERVENLLRQAIGSQS